MDFHFNRSELDGSVNAADNKAMINAKRVHYRIQHMGGATEDYKISYIRRQSSIKYDLCITSSDNKHYRSVNLYVQHIMNQQHTGQEESQSQPFPGGVTPAHQEEENEEESHQPIRKRSPTSSSGGRVTPAHQEEESHQPIRRTSPTSPSGGGVTPAHHEEEYAGVCP